MRIKEIPPHVIEKFLALGIAGEPDACWIWRGNSTKAGYGVIDRYYVHRIAWTAVNGPIPEDKPEIRHVVCGNPPCVNLSHLTPGTHAENMEDMVAHGRSYGWKSQNTHCPQGHPYEGDNLRITRQGSRRCKQCARDEAMKRSRARGVQPRPNTCPQGHEFTPENTGLKPQPDGSVARRCKECARIYSEKYRMKRKES